MTIRVSGPAVLVRERLHHLCHRQFGAHGDPGTSSLAAILAGNGHVTRGNLDVDGGVGGA